MTLGIEGGMPPGFLLMQLMTQQERQFLTSFHNFKARSCFGKAFLLSLEGNFICVLYVDAFLEDLDWKELLGYNDPMDTVAYAVQ